MVHKKQRVVSKLRVSSVTKKNYKKDKTLRKDLRGPFLESPDN